MNEYFQIEKKDLRSKARIGLLKLPSKKILETPAYAIVGTDAEVRCLKRSDFSKAKINLIIANTYHLWRKFRKDLNKFPGLTNYMKAGNITIMTDSGGFQIFSLGFGRLTGVGKVLKNEKFNNKSELEISKKNKKNLVKITKDGVFFKEDKKIYFLSPELSIKIQHKLGADIILAFDECTSPLHSYEYQKKALRRTHRWAKICLETHNKLSLKEGKKQLIFGIIQGGIYRDLRKESSKFIGKLPFDGFAVGGSFGEKEMKNVIRYSLSSLPPEKPRHLLGIGRIENILDGVEEGIDTFDCVIPTREARHGAIWTLNGRFDAKKSENKNSKKPLEKGCGCFVCAKGLTRGELYDMFHSKDKKAGEYATLHNVYFFNNFMEKIREAIKNDKFLEFKSKIVKNLKKKDIKNK